MLIMGVAMTKRIHQEFMVDVSLDVAWQYFSCIEQWLSWAKHIKQVQLEPPGELTPTSSGAFHLSNGVRTTFRMVEYNHHQH